MKIEFHIEEDQTGFAIASCRYRATLGAYDLDAPTGEGPTPADAIREWLDLHEDKLE